MSPEPALRERRDIELGPRFRFDLAVDGGCRLATDVYLPAAEGRWPVVLMRTYLGREKHAAEASGWASRGFACAVQDVRGRYGSSGEWRPYTVERRDGRATVEWLLSEPWCDGRIAAVGGSYAAFTAWSAAVSHPAVRAVISSVPAMRPMPLQPEDGRALPLLARLCWWLSHVGSPSAREDLAETVLRESPESLLHLPITDLPERLGVDLPGWREAVLESTPATDSAPGTDSAAATDSIRAMDALVDNEQLAELDVPALHVGGWHDPFCAETLSLYERAGSALDPRPPRGLVLGPWWHRLGSHRPARYGERDYGPGSRFGLGAYQVAWLSDVLEDRAPADRPVRIFLGGENRWLELETGWAADGGSVAFHLAAPDSDLADPEGANPGSGSLARHAIADRGQFSFPYDPENPHPCRRTPLDESGLAPRVDRVVFTSAPMASPLRILGTPRLSLWARTDAPATDWVARLLEITRDGRWLYLAHGLVDAPSHLAEQGESLVPGVAHRVDIRLSPVGFTLPEGHRLRLEITSSAFPSYARNLASGEPRATGRHPRKARQTVFWGADRSSVLVLPVHLEASSRKAIDIPAAVEAATGSELGRVRAL